LVITKYLKDQDFYIQVRYKHLLNEEGERTNQRVRDIFICNAQITLRRRFVSDFLCETDASIKNEALQQRRLEPSELPNISTLQTGKDETIVQLCEWHAAKAVQRRLVHASRYSKEKRKRLTDLINA
jgi:hypothetical protein